MSQMPAERTARDIALLTGAVLLAIVRTLVSFLLYDADAPAPLLAAWVLTMDLGVRLGLIGVAWALFLRRPGADRLDF